MIRVSAVLVLVACGLTAVADDKPKAKPKNARDVLEAWVAAALAGSAADAAPLADPSTSLGKEDKLKEFKEMLDRKTLKVPTVWVSEREGRATAMSEGVKLVGVKPGRPDTGVVSFKLSLVKGKWLVKDIDFDSEEKAKEKIKAFTKKYPNAKTIPAKGKKG